MKTAVLTTIAIMMLSTTTAMSESKDATYYCVGEFGGGISYDAASKKWQGSVFKVDEKFVLKMKLLGTHIVTTRLAGSEVFSDYKVGIRYQNLAMTFPCTPSFGSDQPVAVQPSGVFRCNRSGQEYAFDVNTGRYMSIYSVGYVGGPDNNDDTPSITGGICTKINE